MPNPYSAQPDHSFWAKTIRENRGFVSLPMSRPFELSKHGKLATAGSCFAQSISQYLMQNYRKNYLQAEPVKAGEPLFPARYGNIYTPAHLLQLICEAKNDSPDKDCAIRHRNGHFVDRNRPYIEKNGFETAEQVRAARTTHLKAVRDTFRNADVFIFTLGMTETWRCESSGYVLPGCPGVYSDATGYEFCNFNISETQNALQSVIQELKEINPGLRIVLTVSPVPLTATYTDQHVMMATTYSKSVLRVACEEMLGIFDHVSYFPSYEMISTPFAEQSFFDYENARNVRSEAVRQVMECFEQSVLSDLVARRKPSISTAGMTPGQDYMCDDIELAEGLDT